MSIPAAVTQPGRRPDAPSRFDPLVGLEVRAHTDQVLREVADAAQVHAVAGRAVAGNTENTQPEIDAAIRAGDAVKACTDAADNIVAMANTISNLAHAIELQAQELARDLRSRGEAFGRLVGSFAKLAEETAETIHKERERLTALDAALPPRDAKAVAR